MVDPVLDTSSFPIEVWKIAAVASFYGEGPGPLAGVRPLCMAVYGESCRARADYTVTFEDRLGTMLCAKHTRIARGFGYLAVIRIGSMLDYLPVVGMANSASPWRAPT